MCVARDRSEVAWFGPFALAAVFVVFAVALLGLVRSQAVEHQRQMVSASQLAVTRSIDAGLESDREYFALLAGDLATGTLSQQAFETRITQYVALHPGLAAVTYTGPDFVIRWVAPYAPNAAVIGLKLDLPEPRRASREARDTRSPVYTNAFQAVQGFPVFEVYVPIYAQDRFLGTVGGVYGLKTFLSRSTSPEEAADNRTEFISEGEPVASVGLPPSDVGDISSESTLSVPGTGLRVRVTRRAELAGAGWVEVLASACIALAVGIAYGMWRLRGEARRRAQTALDLEKSEALLADIIDGTTDAIYVKDLDGRYLLFNRAASEMAGVPVEDVLGHDDTALFPEETARSIMEGDRRVMAASEPMTYEEHVTLRSGEERVLLAAKGQLRDTTGAIVGLFGSSRDITEAKRKEEMVREQGERLRLALELSGQDVWDFDILSGEIHTTAQYAAMIGADPADVHENQDTWLERIQPDDRERASHALQDCLSGETAGYRAEFRLRRKDGTYFWLSTAGAVAGRDPEGRPLRMIGTHVDVTERKRGEEALARLNRDLEDLVRERTQELAAANQELEAFAYSVSHDLRAPLRHVSGFAELLRAHAAGRLDEKGIHYVDTMADAAHRMGVLIDDLLRFSRVGRAPLNIGVVDMQAGVEAAIAAVFADTADRSIEWSVGSLPPAMGDPALLQQVWANLIGNAVKYSSRQPVAHIGIDCREADDELVYSVKDDGVGFDPAYTGKLFRVFQRLHGTEEFEGTGVGLANVYRIVTRLGGRVWAESELGAGATFYFALPRPEEDR